MHMSTHWMQLVWSLCKISTLKMRLMTASLNYDERLFVFGDSTNNVIILIKQFNMFKKKMCQSHTHTGHAASWHNSDHSEYNDVRNKSNKTYTCCTSINLNSNKTMKIKHIPQLKINISHILLHIEQIIKEKYWWINKQTKKNKNSRPLDNCVLFYLPR